MSVSFAYGPGTYHIGRLSDELVTAGITPITIRGTTTDIVIVCNDGQAQAAVTTVVNAHNGWTPIAFTVMPEQTAAPAAVADSGVEYFEDNGAGKTRKVIKWPDGTTTTVATQS